MPRPVGKLRFQQVVDTVLIGSIGRRDAAAVVQGIECQSGGVGVTVKFHKLRPTAIVALLAYQRRGLGLDQFWPGATPGQRGAERRGRS